MNHEDKQDRIDAYLLGNASEKEQREMEEEISRNQELSEAVGDTELAMAAIEFHEDQAIKARLQKLEQQLAAGPVASGETQTEYAAGAITDRQAKTNARVVDIRRRRAGQLKLLGYAAALLLLLAVGWWAINTSSGFDAPQLAMESFRPYDNITTGAVRGDNDQTAEAAAFADYDAGNYAAAEEKLAALQRDPVNEFYLGQSLLAQNKFAEAVNVFSELSERSDFALAKESAYYSGLAQLGVGDVAAAGATLSEIANDSGHPMQKEAKALLAKM